MKRWMALIPLALLAVLVVVSVSRLTSTDPAPATFASPTRPAPDVAAPALAGGDPVSIASLRGRPVLVNFWATWCTPCRAEHPLLVALKQEGVEIVGVLHKDKPELANELLARDGDPFDRVMLDPVGDVSIAFGISGVPETFLVDAQGMIVRSLRGPLDGAEAQAFLEAWRAEQAKQPAG